jgi:hypothetical protein
MVASLLEGFFLLFIPGFVAEFLLDQASNSGNRIPLSRISTATPHGQNH